MKIRLQLSAAVFAALFAVSSCSYLPADSNKTITEQAVDQAGGAEKIGIAECDDLFEELARYAENPDDNIAKRSAKRYAANKLREDLKQRIEKNKSDKTKIAKDCREYRGYFDMMRNQANQ